jgi:hypothetical protein
LLILAFGWIGLPNLLTISGYLILEGTTMPQRSLLFVAPFLVLAAGFACCSEWVPKAGTKKSSVPQLWELSPERTVPPQQLRDSRFTREILHVGVAADHFRQRAMPIHLDGPGLAGSFVLKGSKGYP